VSEGEKNPKIVVFDWFFFPNYLANHSIFGLQFFLLTSKESLGSKDSKTVFESSERRLEVQPLGRFVFVKNTQNYIFVKNTFDTVGSGNQVF